MNYDKTNIPAGYDRGRTHGPEVMQLWMETIAKDVARPVETILDLGCGTGRFSEGLADHFDADVIGIDPSEKMLEQARAKLSNQRVIYQVGGAESIPLGDDSVDLVFISMVFHHFEDPARAARECHRVLRKEGTVFLRAGARERISAYPYVNFFPQSRPILAETLPTTAFMREIFERAGFQMIAARLVTQEIAPSFAEYAERLEAGADSVLAQLSQTDFDAGMLAIRSHAAAVDITPVSEPIDVLVFRR